MVQQAAQNARNQHWCYHGPQDGSTEYGQVQTSRSLKLTIVEPLRLYSEQTPIEYHRQLMVDSCVDGNLQYPCESMTRNAQNYLTAKTQTI